MQETGPVKMQFASIRKIILWVLLTSFIFSVGYGFGYNGFVLNSQSLPHVTITREVPLNQKNLNFSLFWNVWDTLSEKYYDKDKLIQAQMVYGAIEGMVSAVGDPYTMFLPPSQNKLVEDDLHGNFSGIGIEIGFKGNQLAVTTPLPDSPAEKEDIRPGDLIVGIKDTAKKIEKGTGGMSLSEAVEIIRGPINTKVTLVLVREGMDKPFDVSVTRQTIAVPSIKLTYVGENNEIAHLKVQKFGSETVDEWNKAVIDILQKPEVSNIVLDVRNNPGGYMQASISLASEFLETGRVVVIEDHGSSAKKEYKSEKLGKLRNRKVVMLVNAGSASASEILAGALRDNLSIKLIGEKTFGKGTIQEPLPLEGGSGLHVTIAKWLTPNGTWVHEKGLSPDIEIKNNPDTQEDEQLNEAIKVVNNL